MSNTREILDMAARAAGHTLHWAYDGSMCWLDRTWDAQRNNDQPWNPLLDDGDALRLAVKLRLDVMTCGQHREQDKIQVGGAVRKATFQQIEHPGEAYAATRRAIVQAAAEIGRGMP